MSRVLALRPIPGGKADLNSGSWFSTDAIGIGGDWATATASRRDDIAAEVRRYEQGLLWFLAHDGSIPAAIRAEVSRWGLCRDEFQDHGHWPPLLYVREARRMVGRYVLRQADLQQDVVKGQPIAVGGYRIDAHPVARYVAPSGRVLIDGLLNAPVQPYDIPLRSILPPSGSIANLISVVAISATHVAYASVRVEPTLMAIGEAGGLLAAMAAARDHRPDHVPYEAVRAALDARDALAPHA